jgi:hypothetical protein
MLIGTHLGGHHGAQSNVMVQDITWDVGCGTFDVHINTPKAMPRSCLQNEQFGAHGAVQEREVKEGAEWFCTRYIQPGDQLGESDAPVSYTFVPNFESGGGSPFDPPPAAIGLVSSYLRFEVKWVQDCKADKVNLQNPLGFAQCQQLLYDNWKNCKCPEDNIFILKMGLE